MIIVIKQVLLLLLLLLLIYKYKRGRPRRRRGRGTRGRRGGAPAKFIKILNMFNKYCKIIINQCGFD